MINQTNESPCGQSGHHRASSTASRVLGHDRGPRRLRHAVSQVKAGLRGLIVAHVLVGHAQPVDRVVHQGVEAVGRRDRRRVDPQLLAVRRSPDDLLSPVAEDVGAETRGRLRGIVGRRNSRP